MTLARILAPGLAAFALCGTIAPAGAQDTLGYSLASQVPALCTLEADVYAASNDPASAVAVRAGESGTVRVDLAVAGAQEIGRVGAICNGGSATVTVDSSNGFRLITAGGGANREIPYTLSVAGTPVTNVSAQASYVENDVSSNLRRSLAITVGNVNFLLVAAGEYSDTLTLSVTPNS